MKRAVLILLSITFFTKLAMAQAPNILFNRALGGTNYDAAVCISKTNDGGYVIAGITYSNDGDLLNSGLHGWQSDCMVMKFSAGGILQWTKAYGGFAGELFNAIQQTNDGGYIAVGTTSSSDGDVTTGPGGWLVKMDSDGTIQWQARAGTTGNAVTQTTDGGYLVGGDYHLTKFNSVGIQEWIYTTQQHIIRSLCQTTEGSYVATGEASTLRGLDFRVVKLSSNGTLLWENDYGGFGDDNPNVIRQTSDGGYIVAGSTTTRNDGNVTGHHGQNDFWIVKLNSNFEIEWTRALGGTLNDFAYDAVQTNDGGYMIIGETYSTDGDLTRNDDGGYADGWIVKLNSSGSLLWQKSLGGTDHDHFRGIIQNADGSYLITGFTMSADGGVSGFHTNPSGNTVPDAWLVKLAAEGVLPITFGNIEASIKNNVLTVNWTSITEINNDYYLIETSTDGKTFTSVSDKIFSKANNGNSSVVLPYSFSKNLPIHGLAWLPLCIIIGIKRPKQLRTLALLAMTGCCLLIFSCKKNIDSLINNENQKLYIRLVQIDKDGHKAYSKIIIANHK